MIRKLATSVFAGVLLLVAANPAPAQSSQLPIVRDAEIEALLTDYARPLLRAAGVKADRTEIVLVNSPAFNAFVSGRRIFVYTGALAQSDTPNEIIGVLAHEIGHLAGGHQDRLRQQIDRAQAIAVVTTALGIGAVIAGGSSGNRAAANAGAGVLAGGPELARRGLLSYQRSEELTADRSAITYLNKTKQSAKGLLTTMKHLERSVALISDRVNPYLLSHPMPRDRIAALEETAKKSPYYGKTDSASLQERHDMARAKILAYTSGASAVESFARQTKSPRAAEYGRAIAKFLYGSPRAALPMIDKLIKGDPSNPYFQEMKGEIELKAQDARGAVNAFTRASQLDKRHSGLIQSALGHALVLQGDPKSLRRAIGELEVALTRDPANPMAYRNLAMAYGRLGDIGNADLATAEENFYSGQYKDAKSFAGRAKTRFAPNSPQWLRADDIQRFQIPRTR